jgi:A/G-specific adenine glycosylase
VPRDASSTGPSPATSRALIAWFRRERRPLPWRTGRDPYRIWVAEVMLQQTRVDQAVPLFERFVRRFPTIRSLARARSHQVLKVWQGAGYYARARHLHDAARRLVRDHDGQVPRSVDALEQLPGVGPYIARAIAALAFGGAVVPVDANALRVASRWTREEGDIARSSVRRRLADRLGRLAPPRAAGEFAEALMELGETVCRPRRPRCGACPVASDCRAAVELDDPSSLPRRGPRSGRPHVRAAVVALERDGRWLVQRRPRDGLLGGLWEFPGGKVEDGESMSAAARRELREETGATAGALRRVAVVRHGYSHFTVELHVYRGEAVRLPRPARDRRWATLEQVRQLPLPRATEKIVDALDADPATAVPGGRLPVRPPRGPD